MRGTIEYFGNVYPCSIEPVRKQVRVRFRTKGGGIFVRDLSAHRVRLDLDDADRLAQKLTAFGSLKEMAEAGGNYRPTIRTVTAEEVLLADAYDRYQAQREDRRRAYRAGSDKTLVGAVDRGEWGVRGTWTKEVSR